MDEILNNILSEDNKFKSENWIIKNYPDFHFFIASKFKFNVSWKEKLYLYVNNIDSLPTCYCGNSLKFEKGKYRKYCSVKCLSNSDEVKEKRKNTCLSKYGTDNPMKNETIKESYYKSINDKFGVKNISQLETTKDKVKKSNKERYGVEYVSQLESNREKLKDLMLLKSKELILFKSFKISSDIQNKIDFSNLKFLKFTETSIYEIQCDQNHSFTIHKNTLNDRIKNGNTICTICNPINSSSDSQNQLFNFIKENYNGELISNNRSLIGLELDIYLPDLKLAFEYNGIYWHSDIYKNKNYHSIKTNKCLDIGVQLIHIWEDDWLYKKDIVKSRILNLLGKSNKIWARKCEIKIISNKDCSTFLENNHIQGNVISKIRIGLFHKNKLVSVMTFGKLRRSLGMSNTNGYYELLRFCNECNTTIVGGASKLLNYFLKNNSVSKIYSYADRCWSNGNLYENLGFKLEGITGPNYYYIVNGIRKNRFNFRKDRLVNMGYDISKSESEIMKELGYNRIYDSGSLRFSYTINK